jgi:uncharacterized protein (DUF362 family)/Pyruvate/2-oxoacid:ferredoxin oxidoreductase delta subunit
MKSTVAVVACEGYYYPNVLKAVKRGIDLLGGISQFAATGENILLKPNLLAGEPPEKAVTTHPAVFKAVAEVFKEAGANVSYGDSPGLAQPHRAAAKAGLYQVAQELSLPLADFKDGSWVPFPEAKISKTLKIAAGVLASDGLVSLPKLKTHGFTRLTGAVKNQFGCVPGLVKGEYHVKMPDIFDFSRVLVEINLMVKPRLSIMDAVIAMEGNGPRSGDPFPMKALIMSTDPAALDATACRLIHLNPNHVPYLPIAREVGLGTHLAEEIELVGDDITPMIRKDFDVVRKPPHRYASAEDFPTFLKRLISPKPVINYNACIRCGECIKICPVKEKAVNWDKEEKDRKPVYNYDLCIRCYCCQEICPSRAITVKVPLLGRIIHR